MALDLRAYLDRIGYDGPAEPTLETLRRLHARHPAAIPFENLDPRFGVTPRLDLEALQAKLVAARRGGYCFEQNTLFAAVLEALGFSVETLIARVRWRQPEDAPLTPRSHMLLKVTAEGRPWLCDVGFGGLGLTAPLAFEPGAMQQTPHEPFRLVDKDGELEQQALIGGDWTPTYRFGLQPAPAADYEVGNWFCATHPQSHFTFTLIAARAAPEGRRTLMNAEFVRRGLDGKAERRLLTNGAEIAKVLRDDFGIEPPAYSDLDAVAVAAATA